MFALLFVFVCVLCVCDHSRCQGNERTLQSNKNFPGLAKKFLNLDQIQTSCI